MPRTRGRIGDARLKVAIRLRGLKHRGVPLSHSLIQKIRGKYPKREFVVTPSDIFQEQFDMRMAKRGLFNRSRRHILFRIADWLPEKTGRKLRGYTAAGTAAFFHLLEFVQEGKHPLIVKLRKRYKYFYMQGGNLIFTNDPKGFDPHYDKKWETARNR